MIDGAVCQNLVLLFLIPVLKITILFQKNAWTNSKTICSNNESIILKKSSINYQSQTLLNTELIPATFSSKLKSPTCKILQVGLFASKNHTKYLNRFRITILCFPSRLTKTNPPKFEIFKIRKGSFLETIFYFCIKNGTTFLVTPL